MILQILQKSCFGSRVFVGAAAKQLTAVKFVRSFTTQTEVREVVLEKLADNPSIATITMNRPKANAIGKVFLQQLRGCVESARFDPSVRVVIIQSALPKIFCAGADLKERRQMTPEEVARFVYGIRAALSEVEQLPVPTIAAIEGSALGGGAELAISCDLRVAGAKAKIGFPETGLAIIPGGGGTQRLPRLVGIAKAKELIWTCDVLSAEQARDVGLVDYAVAEGEALKKAIEIASKIVTKVRPLWIKCWPKFP
eukprot:TRINITY_DN2366_c0_g2_i4.p1 TRINITY_DN2366_c0_g2~~TRINITY_DN2366_c0_g2_i4.p1  ORF type:complete len:254 (+),score=56.96 TRINITY_DN2366_c0_g2_i4:69-830(+)